MLRNAVEELANAPGAAVTVQLAGPPAGRLSWLSSFQDDDVVYYGIGDGTQWEWGQGTVNAGTPNTLSRTTVLANSARTLSRLNFSGACRVFNELPAERVVLIDQTGAVSASAAQLGVPLWAGVAGGTANGIVLTVGQSIGTRPAGTLVRFIVGASNTSSTVNLRVEGTTGAVLLDHQGERLLGGDLQAGDVQEVIFDGTNWRLSRPLPRHSRYPGELVDYTAGTPLASLPPGFLSPDGRNVSRTTYAQLHQVYAAIGYPYGAGDGSTTFGIPDLRGRLTVGRDNMGGDAAGRLANSLGNATAATLGAAGGDDRIHAHMHDVDEPPHGHTGVTDGQGLHDHEYERAVQNGFAGGTGTAVAVLEGAVTSPAGHHAHNLLVNSNTIGITVQVSGGGTAQNVPPVLVVNKILYAGT